MGDGQHRIEREHGGRTAEPDRPAASGAADRSEIQPVRLPLAAIGPDSPAFSPASSPAGITASRAPPQLVGPVGMDLPPSMPLLTRGDLVGLASATLLHAVFAVSVLAPDNRLGANGIRPDALGVDIVVLAAALKGQGVSQKQARRDAATGLSTGAIEPPSESSDATADLRRLIPERQAEQQVEQPRETTTQRAAAPADLVLPDWKQPPLPPEARSDVPVIASRSAAGDALEAAPPQQPTAPPLPFSAPLDSRPHEAAEPVFAGSQTAGGGEAIDMTTAALALARAGPRDKYGATVYAALRDNPPAHVPGATARVTIRFTVTPSGRASDSRVTVSSRRSRVDAAALAAVRSTLFPRPSLELSAQDLTFTMEYTFR